MKTEPKPATGEWTEEALARQFHELYESYACEFAYETRQETRAFDPTTPNGRLMIAVCKAIADAHNAALAAEKRARLFSEHDLIAKFDEQLAAEREKYDTMVEDQERVSYRLREQLAAAQAQ